MSEMFATKSPNYVAELNHSHPWQRNEFAYLGTVTHHEGWTIGWAWHADGRSIDRDDRAFDLIDFPPPAPTELLACKPKPIVCLPLMTKPAREVEKSTKYLPEVWTCAELRLKNDG